MDQPPPPRKSTIVHLLELIASGTIGAFCFILVQWLVSSYFPGLNRETIREMPGPNGIPLTLHDPTHVRMPVYAYRCAFVGTSPPVSDGFLGLSKTPPFWWYNIWIANLSDANLKDVAISANAPSGSTLIALKSSLQSFSSKPGGRGHKYISGRLGATGFLNTLPANEAMRVHAFVESSAAPDPANLNISVWCGDVQFERVSHRRWSTITWQDLSSP